MKKFLLLLALCGVVVAEAKGLRALCYLYLGMGWGTPPIVDHVLKSSEKPGNATSPTIPETTSTGCGTGVATI